MADEAEISQFIRIYIPSVWALELLLLLRADPARRWSPAELLKELRASTSLVDENLAHFERQGLALKDDANIPPSICCAWRALRSSSLPFCGRTWRGDALFLFQNGQLAVDL